MQLNIQLIKFRNILLVVTAILVLSILIEPIVFGSSNLTSYFIAGVIASIMLFYGLVLIPIFLSKKISLIERRVVSAMEKVAVLDIIPLGPVSAMKPVTLRLKVRNPLNTFGVRLRFRSFDYINPSNLDLLLEPGEEEVIDVIFIPTSSGLREFSVSVAPLYDENDNLIPDNEADDIAIQKFSIEVEETVIGGLSSRERGILSGLIKFATFLSASGLIYFSILRVSGLEALVFVLTQVVPIIAILQVPALMLFFYLEKKLPEKPSFKFEEVE